ncbi:hypothetical protein J4E91_001671 [Alternaria rosae]|nr:hypothetical protein J4E91_001671 [Alternaria rosae]
MSFSIPTNAVQGRKSDLEDFLHRANNAGLHTTESSANDSGNWEVVDKDEALHEQDKDEWTLIGKTVTEKQEEAERKERMEKQKEERKAEKRTEKHSKRVSYAEAAAAVRKI